PVRTRGKVFDVGNPPGGSVAKAVALDLAQGASHAFVDVRVTIPADQHAASWNQVYQAFEGGLHFVKVAIDVGMVELDRGKDQGVGEIVQKFRPLIEERGVV